MVCSNVRHPKEAFSAFLFSHRNEYARRRLIRGEPGVQFVDVILCQANVMLNSLKLKKKG